VIIGITIVYLYFKFNVIWTGEKIALKELGAIELSKGNKEHDFFDDEYWLVITGDEQRTNWVESGYKLPQVDFDKTFIILSNHKIKALYKEDGCDACTGVPNGFAVYDYFNSTEGAYYIYEIPSIWLSQGVG
jgi:hypothetical protein